MQIEATICFAKINIFFAACYYDTNAYMNIFFVIFLISCDILAVNAPGYFILLRDFAEISQLINDYIDLFFFFGNVNFFTLQHCLL
ncbi:hypothetical protein PUN28_013661 [Cardiocondyla obscurior]|uniref:Uncharacterized protein n=1 Tax=Cardiocondyla obscurior TaxID=286306 RepID=A0AAW2F3S1_9HYME